MSFYKYLIFSIVSLSLYSPPSQAQICIHFFARITTAEELFKTMIDQFSAKDLQQIKKDIIDFENTTDLLALLNPDWGEVRLLSASDSIYFSLQRDFQSFRLNPNDKSERAPTVHFIYRTGNSLGRIIGPRLVLTHVILGPYNLNRVDPNIQSIEIENRKLRQILFEWSRNRDPEISTVNARESGL